jgi:hypothetical protein
MSGQLSSFIGRLLHLQTLFRIALCLVLLAGTGAVCAQGLQTNKLDLSITYIAERSLKANASQNFWMHGGSVELGTNLWRGWGPVADVTGVHTGSIGASGVPLSLVTMTFGPRYRWHSDRRLSFYGQGLFGEAYGFRSLFPAITGAQTQAHGFATQVGGGIDYQLSDRLAIRVIDAGWLRTELPNSTNNVQNTLRLGAGVVLRFGH